MRRRKGAGLPAHRVWLMASCLAPVSGSAATPHSQNLISWSALPLTKPLESGRAASDHTGPVWALQDRGGTHGRVSAQQARGWGMQGDALCRALS